MIECLTKDASNISKFISQIKKLLWVSEWHTGFVQASHSNFSKGKMYTLTTPWVTTRCWRTSTTWRCTTSSTRGSSPSPATSAGPSSTARQGNMCIIYRYIYIKIKMSYWYHFSFLLKGFLANNKIYCAKQRRTVIFIFPVFSLFCWKIILTNKIPFSHFLFLASFPSS